MRRTDSEIQNATFRNIDKLETWTPTKRKKGRPKYKWTEKTIEDMWNSVKETTVDLRNTNYDTNNQQVIRAMMKHAKTIYET